MILKCTSCRETLLSEGKFTRFKCPACEKVEIIRCVNCRRKSTPYVCSNCDFEGP